MTAQEAILRRPLVQKIIFDALYDELTDFASPLSRSVGVCAAPTDAVLRDVADRIAGKICQDRDDS